MNKKEVSKRYLTFGLILFFAGAVLIAALLAALKGRASVDLTAGRIALISVSSAVLALGSFTGFVLAGLWFSERDKPDRAVIIAVCVFFPITLALLTVFGIIMIIPANIKAITVLLRGD